MGISDLNASSLRPDRQRSWPCWWRHRPGKQLKRLECSDAANGRPRIIAAVGVFHDDPAAIVTVCAAPNGQEASSSSQTTVRRVELASNVSMRQAENRAGAWKKSGPARAGFLGEREHRPPSRFHTTNPQNHSRKSSTAVQLYTAMEAR